MTLLGMLSVALLASIRYGTRIWHASAGAATYDSTMLSVRGQLNALLAQAYPEFLHPAPMTGYAAFDGTPDSMDFLTPDSHIAGGLARTRIAAEQDGSGLALVAAATPELAATPSASRRVLLRRLSAVAFSYYGRGSSRDTSSWQTTWHERTVPPDLVRIRVQFADRPARPWPELIVAPRIHSDASCMFDALTRTCAGRD